MATQKILTISEVAALLKVHPITVYRMIKQGRLPAFRIGRVLRFDADRLEDWLRVSERAAAGTSNGRKRKGRSSAEYLAYATGETFAPENLLETLAISRPALVRPFVDAKRTRRRPMVCERCHEARKPVTALLLFASEQANRRWKKTAMPFCRTCFAGLKKLAAPEKAGRSALEAASKTDRHEARPVRSAKKR
jgi:excisionase family DNA binding protein